MRVLATMALSFAAGLFLVLVLPWSGWYLWAAAGVCLLALTQFTARGVYALLYQRENVTVTDGSRGGVQGLPLRAVKVLREKIAAVWDDPSVRGFLLAELTGDKSELPEGDAVAMQETGLAHLFAVSGLHCGFLVTLLSLLVPSGRRRTISLKSLPGTTPRP